ncbi:MAG: hypothetical protein AAB229_02175 [Candidatus Hydrogenedentota bacterium]
MRRSILLASESGFSLVELLMVTIITVIVLGVMVMSASAYAAQSSMTRASSQLVIDIERLQSTARVSRHTTRLTRLATGYHCLDDNDTKSPLNVTRKFPGNVAWAPSSEFAPNGSQIIFPRNARPHSAVGVPLTETSNDLVIWVPGRTSRTIAFAPALGMISVK